MEFSLDMPFQESEDSLVERALHCDKAAFTALYERNVDRIYRHAYYRIGNQADAEDITEEVFIRAWKSIGKYKNIGAPFVAWLLKIVHNLIVDYYKSKKKHITLEKVEVIAGSASDPANIAEANIDRERIKKAIMKLKGDKRQVVQMHFIDGFSYAEIACALKKTEGAVRVIQCRALNELKDLLEEQ